MNTERELYDRLAFYTLERRDPGFIHQHIVDAYCAQHAEPGAKPIALAFALIGLYLHVEKGFTGRQVQMVHMQLARHREKWPSPTPPEERGSIRVGDVLATPEGAERDAMIHCWCKAVWDAWKEHCIEVIEMARGKSGLE